MTRSLSGRSGRSTGNAWISFGSLPMWRSLCSTPLFPSSPAKSSVYRSSMSALLVVWSLHGIYGAGKDLDETFGLIETAEKAAEIYMKIAHLPRLNTISDEQMRLLEQRFGVKAREGYLD